MSLSRKVLLLLLLLGWSTTFTQVGTFASFSATVTDGASFATGSLVLSDSVNGGTACLSTGVATSTDVNSNSGCAAAFTLAAKKPGDSATATIQVTNTGSLAATALAISGAGCTTVDDVGTYHGSGDLCPALQTYVQQTTPTAACRYGKGASGVINSTARTFPMAITNSTRTFSLNVDNVAHNNLTIATNAAYTATGLATAINNVISAWATATVGLDNIIYISSNTTGASSKVTITNGSSNNALPTLGFTTGTTNTGGQTTCSYDAVHTVDDFMTSFATPATGIATGGLSQGATGTFVVGLSLPLAAGNDLQGRVATFGHTFTASQ